MTKDMGAVVVMIVW